MQTAEAAATTEQAPSTGPAPSTNPVPSAEQAPFLSIVMPAYNGESLIRDAITCALNQPCRDLELIIGNDGSTDSTLAICEEFAAADPRVRIDDHVNYGLGKNLNELVRKTRGKWLIILSQDDAIVDDFYTDELKAFLETCAANDIEVIVPARLHSKLGESKTRVDYVPEHGLVGQYSPTSWDIQHELSSLLYSLDNIRRNELWFYEGYVEMESIWRHKNVYTARKALFTNDFYFAIRHRHDAQITSTWDFFKISPVRIETYWDLCLWHEQVNGSDAAACQRSWETLSDIVVNYVLDAYKKYGIGPKMDEALRVGRVGELLDAMPKQLGRTHRRILKGRRFKFVLNWARDNKDKWQHRWPVKVKKSTTSDIADLQAAAADFPAAYAKNVERCNLKPESDPGSEPENEQRSE